MRICGLCMVTNCNSQSPVNGLFMSQILLFTKAIADISATLSEMCLAQSYGVEMFRFIAITTSSSANLYFTSIFSILPNSDRCLRFSSSKSWLLRFLTSALDNEPVYLEDTICVGSFKLLAQNLLHLHDRLNLFINNILIIYYSIVR